MTKNITRRRFMEGAAAGGLTAATIGSALPFRNRAWAKETITGVEWGPPYIDETKKILAKYDKADLTWELHQGGAAAILAKIKATWPNTAYDVVDMWSPVFVSCVKEGWAEPLTAKEVPNLADVPAGVITKDAKGNFMNVPRNLNFALFAARGDTVPIEIKKIDDLFDPKLKGQIAWPSPILNTCLQVVALSLANGGSETNMEPGWKALKELAKTGNIGRVVFTTTDIINTLSSGETSVTFADLGTLSGVAANFPMKYYTKTDPSIKCFLAVEGWIVLSNSKKKQAAFDFINFLVSPENSTAWCAGMQVPPASSKAKAAKGLEHAVFTDEELKKYAHLPDYEYVSKQIDPWVKRFESEVVPLLK